MLPDRVSSPGPLTYEPDARLKDVTYILNGLSVPVMDGLIDDL